ncbi:hypothetical protein G7013_24945 [Pseudomonas viridiflava]|uniref:hypothetical protein n=1 Tax=Pseudomonas viridiflava TaxID=33069 RepID=UPI0015E325F9|nr:hypothetical protein [Pseudomonas viridiflava]MBA1232900.1 hypothetical protein [Pseudomonas viridiflava]
MSYYDEELTETLAKLNVNYKKLPQGKHDHFVDRINKKFVFNGSKVYWRSLPNSISFERATKEAKGTIIEKIKTSKPLNIIIIGDSLTEDAYHIGTDDLSILLELFSGIPQHTYFFPEDISWIVCLSLEGQLDFGEANN